MEKILSSIILFICSILLIYMNRRYKRMCLKKVHLKGKNAFFFNMMYDVTLYVFITNYLFPICTHIIYNYSIVEYNNVTLSELTLMYIIELVSWWIFYQTFYSLCKRNTKYMSYRMVNSRSLEIIATVILIIYFFYRIATLGVQEDEPNEWEQRLFFILPFINLAGYMLAIFITFAGRRYFSPFLWYMAVAATGAFLLGAFLGGIRGAIVNPIVWACYVVYQLRPTEERGKYFLVFAIILVGFTLIQPIFMGFRVMNNESTSLEDKIEMAQSIADNRSLQNTDRRYEAKNLLEELDYRYGAQGIYTVGFYRLVDKNGYVGANCIMNSFYTFLPSVLYSGKKAVSTSSDGTVEGMGMYKCVNAIDGSDNMCGFFTSGHAYWEFGLVGIILFSIIPAIFDFWCIRLFRRLDIIGIPLYTSIFMKGFTQYKMWVSLIVLEFAQIILPVFLLIWIYNMFKTSQNRKLHFNSIKTKGIYRRK